MYLMYIDESGDTISLSQKGKKFLVLTGCIFEEKDIPSIEQKFREIKKKYYQDPDIEIKSNFLRYASPDLSQSSPMKLNSKEKYDELEKDVSDFLKDLPITLFSVIIDKTIFWKEFPSQNPYDTAYLHLLESFQKHLEDKKGLGICIIDPREGQVEKAFIGQELESIHHKTRWQSDKSPNVVERLLFATSDRTIGIQIADLFCYPIYHMMEYGKKPGTYWRYDELSREKLKDLLFYPSETKKDLL